jgi:hypothetical protein
MQRSGLATGYQRALGRYRIVLLRAVACVSIHAAAARTIVA